MKNFERFVTAATANMRKNDGNNLKKIESDDGESYHYSTYGTCSKDIFIELDGDKLKHVRFNGGCPGGLTAMGKLLEGFQIDDVIEKVKGIPCRNGTSCGDQLAQALEQIKELRAKEQPTNELPTNELRENA